MDAPPLHIAMYPWFAMGHFTPFLHLSNKLAKRGHKISFIIPKRAQTKIQHLNLHPHLITFVPITVPHVEGLPHDADTTADIPFSLFPLLATAMDRTEKHMEHLLREIKPQIIFFDFSFWLPNLAQSLGIKCFQYLVISPVTVAYLQSHERQNEGRDFTEFDLIEPPSGFPDSSIKLYAHEARFLAAFRKVEFGSGVLFHHRFAIGAKNSHAIGFKGCREIEGPYVDYLEDISEKPVFLSGPLLPETPHSTLEEKWIEWLGGFKAGSVVFCEYGSESTLQHNQFHELLLGLELTGFPFLAALKPPNGFESIEEALPEGFKERVQGRGVVYDGWVQQQLILGHPSVGCFITHCGSGSLTESLISECQLVFLPRLGSDYVFNARLLSRSLKVGVEVEKGEEDGLSTKESVCKAVKSVMDDGNELGQEVRANHAKVRNLLLDDNLESFYIDSLCNKLQALI
ncbi:UDP-glycosyltransferase 79B30-like [Abrus precatorius]|uniref:UDP-glycosyltransferase 79B30-like n=1 Tax=Abrus precatorius TaxID=3816 RepID=A0A8B8KC16_ABRPR|nr:UDP-glycosyltransferase 79B30-like [Abrus precatorius]WMX26744.1 UGT79B84 [Abrus precatorius]